MASFASVTLIENTSPVFIVTVRVSALSKGSILISAQSPASIVCALISAICSSVSSTLYVTASPLASFSSPTTVSLSIFPIQTRLGEENSTFSTASTNLKVSSLTVTSLRVSGLLSSELPLTSSSSTAFSVSLLSAASFKSSVFATPNTSTSCRNETNPPPGIENLYIFPLTSQWKSTV